MRDTCVDVVAELPRISPRLRVIVSREDAEVAVQHLEETWAVDLKKHGP